MMRRVQMRLIPMLLFLYLITYLDKTNIGTVFPSGIERSPGADNLKAMPRSKASSTA